MTTEFRPPNLALSTIGLSLATFMQVLDTTIANVSLPTIAGNLGVSNNQSTWVITSFAVSMAIALPLTGFLSRRFGEVRLFTACTLLFALTSFLCGVSQSMGMLILFRALQGAVAGPMYPITQSLLIGIYPPAKRGMALALLAMVTVVAPIAGPILGGWITDNYSWPWIFFINVPIGIFASMVVANQLRAKEQKTERPKVDYVGLITLIIGVGALQIVLDKGNDEDWFNSTFIIVTSIVSAIGIAVFLIWELTDKDPIVDLKLFRHRNFTAGTIALILAYAAFFAIGLLVPLWLQRNLGYTSTWAGFATAPIGVLPVLLTFFVGKYATHFDLRTLASIAFIVMAGTCFMRSDFFIGIDFYHVAVVQLWQGLGVALFFMPILTILLSDLQQNEIAAGSGLATFLRTLGGSFSASLTTLLWERRAVAHHEQLTEHITAYSPTAQAAMGQLGHGDNQLAGGIINDMITQQAYQISFNEVFHALGWIFLALVLVIWLARPPFTPKARTVSGGH
ncbi:MULTISPECIES: DHA2 family efflux MFS transporter permease subunit [unclassified Rhodanobacter]|uniref:DHA2 family efflux MFS transporter permease subunit n=1 Tax=unclassified Rhodanobacter TaxID=2621553 RepID=UPI0007A9A136|nr:MULTISPECIES: DHA2 family efflux MFS transporter permease subunit [unclassified Rhodanobacter]KZC17813.1 multidrug resistance protein B [Rhodanobacter sp. FW104-R8]KZC27183.1 multidrug resistance protein B [Rhodanobacter sp. FW510-T8]KZC31621.1 multidrug resistance protein B [Rhodanobacter sp. FW510-R10]